MSETQTPETQQGTHTPEELAYQAAQQAAGFGDPYTEEAGEQAGTCLDSTQDDGPQDAYPTQEHDDETYALNHPEDSEQPSPRTFYRSDYGRAARLIQAARHVPGDPYTAKPEAQLDSVSALACTLVQVFQADWDRFDAEEFIRATWLPVRPDGGWAAAAHIPVDEDPIGEYQENEGPAEMAALEAFIDPE